MAAIRIIPVTPAILRRRASLTCYLEGKAPCDDSFCGNEACHGSVWTYAGFDAPELEPILTEQLEALIAAAGTSACAPGAAIREAWISTPALTYDEAIGSMLIDACFACHGTSASGGLDITSYQSLLDGGDSGPGIVANDLEASHVYLRQTEATPHYVQLDEEQIQLLMEWILAGAPEN